ncbi:hypothetical protein MKW98_017213 [Papaver atlanticum]|uniref:Uncharacterized protein n=1 Tax=Papaver atlanticum TaxID=357466 RepID=A0AAD4SC15_9MAGN|nr:hypothetical protein MKW98_017213 [Papaver atlanticum]
MCNAAGTNVLIESGMHYLASQRCRKKFLGSSLRVEDSTDTAVFVALDIKIQKLVWHTASELISLFEVFFGS